MRNADQVAIVITGAALSAALLMAPVPAMAQVPTPANAIRNAQQFEANARVLTVFDRQGNFVTTVGERAIFENPVFSPDFDNVKRTHQTGF